jgi:hypothetical protein
MDEKTVNPGLLGIPHLKGRKSCVKHPDPSIRFKKKQVSGACHPRALPSFDVPLFANKAVKG